MKLLGKEIVGMYEKVIKSVSECYTINQDLMGFLSGINLEGTWKEIEFEFTSKVRDFLGSRGEHINVLRVSGFLAISFYEIERVKIRSSSEDLTFFI